MSTEHWFEYHGEILEPYYHMYNLTHLNERMVELAIVRKWLTERDAWGLYSPGLEVGNVTGHYWALRHMVFDLHEEPAWYQLSHQKVVAADILDFADMEDHPVFPWVFSLSTIEHTEDPLTALYALRALVAPGGKLLVTFPTGAHPDLDSYVARLSPHFTRECTVVRVENGHGGWEQTEEPEVREYGPWANSVAVLEWDKPE